MEIMHASYFKKFKRIFLFVSIVLPLTGTLTASQPQQYFSISGNCVVQDEGVLYIYLVDGESFKKPMTGLKKLSYRLILEKDKNKKSIPFRFDQLPAGTYGIRCFIDTDGNHVLNRGFFGPSEPWGMSFKEERLMRIPSFSDISFNADKSLEDITIQVK